MAFESIPAKLPIMEIQTTIQNHTEHLIKKVLENIFLGIPGGPTPIIFVISEHWPHNAVLWLEQPDSELGV